MRSARQAALWSARAPVRPARPALTGRYERPSSILSDGYSWWRKNAAAFLKGWRSAAPQLFGITQWERERKGLAGAIENDAAACLPSKCDPFRRHLAAGARAGRTDGPATASARRGKMRGRRAGCADLPIFRSDHFARPLPSL